MLNNLGDVRREMGRTGEAGWLFQRSLAAGINLMGLDHPYVAAALNNLAAVCADGRKYSEAEALCYQSLRIYDAMPEGAQLGIIRANLAQLREAQKRT